MHVPRLRTQNNRWAGSNSKKVEAFANHLEQVYPSEFDYTELDVPSKKRLEEETTKPTIPKEVFKEIKRNLNAEKAPGYNLISGTVMKQLSKKGLVKLTNLIKDTFHIKYVPETEDS